MPSPTASGPSARSVRRLHRRMRRRSSAARPLGEVLSDAYVAAFTLVMVAAVVGRPAGQVLRDAAARSVDGRAPVDLPLALAAGWTLVLLGLALRTLTLLGPLVRDPAEATWLLSAPVDRRGLLLPAASGLLATCAAAGAGAGLVVAALLEGAGRWAAAGACAGVAVGAGTLAVQGTGRTVWVRRAADGCLGGALTVLVLAMVRAAQSPDQPAVRPGSAWAWPVGALVLVTAVAVALRAVPARLARLRRTDLLAGAGLALGLRATVTALDGSFVVETLRLRLLLLRGTVPARPLRGRGVLAVVHADARRVRRRWRVVLLALGATPLVWAADQLYGRVGAATAGVALVWAAAGASAQGLRTVSRSRALARAFPWRDEVLRLAHLPVPAAVAAVAAGVGVALAGRPPWWVPVLVLAALAGVLRTAAGRPPLRFELTVASPMGAVPAGAVAALLTGPDVVLLSSLPLLLGAGPLLCALLPTVAVVGLVLWARQPD